jgi:hypothetical protein
MSLDLPSPAAWRRRVAAGRQAKSVRPFGYVFTDFPAGMPIEEPAERG